MASFKPKFVTPAWTRIKEANGYGPTGPRYRAYHSKARYVVIRAGRRSTKTLLAKRRVARALWEHLITPHEYPDPRYFYAAPTEAQAKAIAWKDLLALIPKELIPRGGINKTELKVETVLGSSIEVFGLDKPSRMEGRPWNGGVADEYADLKAGAWEENIQPALMDRRGWCWQIGVPDMRGPSNSEFRKHFQWGQDPDRPEWESFHWISADVIPLDEILIYKRDMSPQIFRQELEASDETSPGRAYVDYVLSIHEKATPYLEELPILISCDFNFGHHNWGMYQWQPERENPRKILALGETEIPRSLPEQYRAFDEVYLQGMTVEKMCHELERKLKGMGIAEPRKLGKERLKFFGDYSGIAHKAESTYSAWEIVQNYFPKAGYHYAISPPIADRVEKVNSYLQNALGEVRSSIDPKCVNLSRDLQEVTYKMLYGGQKTGELTHASDNFGYLLIQHAESRAIDEVSRRIKQATRPHGH